MPALGKEATRYMIRASGQLEIRLREIALQLAAEQGTEEISAQHIEFALRQLAGDNSSLLQSLLPEGEYNAERRAG